MITLALIERFHEKWQLNSSTGCWDWIASKRGSGYGQIGIPGQRNKAMYAHRLSYLIHCGEVPEGMVVCHVCDNPGCVKPSHLFLGTQRDNLADMASKGRHQAGSRNKMSKLTEEKVRAIHRLLQEGVSQGELGRRYGVTQSVIFRIAHGKAWKDIYREVHGAGQD